MNAEAATPPTRCRHTAMRTAGVVAAPARGEAGPLPAGLRDPGG